MIIYSYLLGQRNDIIDPNKLDPKGPGITHLQRMKNGDGPYSPDNKKFNLHHMLQTNEEAIAEMTATFHQQNTSIIHINPQTIPSGIDRASLRNWRKDYWIQRAKDFEK